MNANHSHVRAISALRACIARTVVAGRNAAGSLAVLAAPGPWKGVETTNAGENG